MSVKDVVKPVALPLWLRLQDQALWRRAVAQFAPRGEERRFQGFGVGLPKTGTVSLAKLLDRDYRAAHEPETWILTRLLKQRSLGHNDGHPTREELVDVLRTRDRLLNLEFESNFVLGMMIDLVYEAFPDARYILTIRDCYSWINSEVNQQHAIGYRQPWRLLADYRYGAWRRFSRHDAVLRKHELYPVARYFAYWANHIRSVLDAVPADQLLVVRTRDLSKRTEDIARFLGVPVSSLYVDKVHSHKRSKKPLDIYELVDRDYIYEQAELYCGDLMRRFYPELVVD